MSSLWTPSGEHQPEPKPEPEPEGQPEAGAPPAAAAGAEGAEERAQLEEEMRRVRAEITATPATDIIANHALGLWQLAVLHLTPAEGEEPRLDEASLAIDALGALVEGLGDRLGSNAEPLRDALAQLRVAFVQIQHRQPGDPASGDSAPGDSAPGT